MKKKAQLKKTPQKTLPARPRQTGATMAQPTGGSAFPPVSSAPPPANVPLLSSGTWDEEWDKAMRSAKEIYPRHFNNPASLLNASVTHQLDRITQDKSHPLHGDPRAVFTLFRTLGDKMDVPQYDPVPETEEQPDPLRAGVLVQLKSGSPIMTSGGHAPNDPDVIQCNWFDGKANVCLSQNFLRGALVALVTNPPPSAEPANSCLSAEGLNPTKELMSHAPNRPPMSMDQIKARAEVRHEARDAVHHQVFPETATARGILNPAAGVVRAEGGRSMLSQNFGDLEVQLNDLHALLPDVQASFQQVMRPSDAPGLPSVAPVPTTGIETVDRVAQATASVIAVRHVLQEFIERSVQ